MLDLKSSDEEREENSRNTIVTSVSISKEFKEILENYRLSPTEVFRKGLGVYLFDLGIERYQTETNRLRSEYVKKFLKYIAEDEEMVKLQLKIIKLAELLKDLGKHQI